MNVLKSILEGTLPLSQELAEYVPKGKEHLIEPDIMKILKEKIKNKALGIADRLKSFKIKIGAKTSSTGKIFGSVNTIQIADVIARKGFEIEVLSFNPATLKLSFQPVFSLIRHKVNSDVLTYLKPDDPAVILFNRIGEKYSGTDITDNWKTKIEA